MQTLFLIRGMPGSGKTTLAKALDVHTTCAADDYFEDQQGNYSFDPKKLPEAHADCQRRTYEALEKGQSVAVHNTFSQRWEMEPYLEMAQNLGVRVMVIDLFRGGCTRFELFRRNLHGVPLGTIQEMESRWEHDWRRANPLPMGEVASRTEHG